MDEPGMIYTSRSGVSSKDENGMRFRVDGSKPVNRDISVKVNYWELKPIWKAPMLMAQLSPGSKWCPCCGDVRPLEMFELAAFDRATWKVLLQAIRFEFQALYRSVLLTTLVECVLMEPYKWCRSCQLSLAPETLWLQYCPHCMVGWQDWQNFSSLTAQYCRIHQAEVNARRSDKANT